MSLSRQDVPCPASSATITRLAGWERSTFSERGFRNFAWFSSIDDAVARLRFGGFHETLGKSDFTAQSWIFRPPARGRNDEWTLKCEFLKKRPATAKPVAVLAHDADAANVLDAADEARLSVPDEVAILGIDNSPLICESVRVPLSSINHDMESVGYEGAALLDRLMRGGACAARPRALPPKAALRQSTEVTAVKDEPLRRALKHILANYRSRDCVYHVASASGISRFTLNRAFRRHLGMSVSDYLATLRLARAKDLLLQTKMPVADVAAQTGFNTQQYFTNVFRTAVGVTPRVSGSSISTCQPVATIRDTPPGRSPRSRISLAQNTFV